MSAGCSHFTKSKNRQTKETHSSIRNNNLNLMLTVTVHTFTLRSIIRLVQWRNQGVHGWALRPPMAVILGEISSWGEIFAKLGGN